MNRNTTVIRVVTVGTGNIVISTNDDDVNEEMNILKQHVQTTLTS